MYKAIYTIKIYIYIEIVNLISESNYTIYIFIIIIIILLLYYIHFWNSSIANEKF